MLANINYSQIRILFYSSRVVRWCRVGKEPPLSEPAISFQFPLPEDLSRARPNTYPLDALDVPLDVNT